MVKPLEINPSFTPRRGPVVLAILDGVGFGKYADGDAVKLANTPIAHDTTAVFFNHFIFRPPKLFRQKPTLPTEFLFRIAPAPFPSHI